MDGLTGGGEEVLGGYFGQEGEVSGGCWGDGDDGGEGEDG